MVIKEELLESMRVFFSLLGNTTRLKIVMELLEQPLNVTQLQEKIDMSQTAVSHQLAALKKSNLVSYKKNGKEKIYFLTDEHVNIILISTRGHIEHTLREKRCEKCIQHCERNQHE